MRDPALTALESRTRSFSPPASALFRRFWLPCTQPAFCAPRRFVLLPPLRPARCTSLLHPHVPVSRLPTRYGMVVVAAFPIALKTTFSSRSRSSTKFLEDYQAWTEMILHACQSFENLVLILLRRGYMPDSASRGACKCSCCLVVGLSQSQERVWERSYSGW